MNAKIEITLQAAEDFKEIKNYISTALHNPQAAADLIKQFDFEIHKTLSMFPESNKIRDELPELQQHGYRILYVKNFAVFYRYEKSNNTVFIEAVQYSKRKIRKEMFHFNT